MDIDRSRIRLVMLLAATGACLVAVVTPAGGQDAEDVGLQVAPAQEEPSPLGDRQYERDLLFTNRDPQTYAVTLSVTELAHDLDGTPQFPDSSKHERAFTLTDDSFTLDPQEKKQVRLEGAIPPGDRSIYVGVVAAFAPAAVQTGGVVETHARVAAQFLLRGPKPWRETVAVEDVGLLPGRRDGFTVYAIVKDTGNVHVAPTGRVEIRKGRRLLATVRLTGGRILPGYARRFRGEWTPPARLDGAISLTALFERPRGRRTETVRFDDGRTLLPAARIENLVARDHDGALIQLEVRNTGTAALRPVLELTATQDAFERARRVAILPGGALRPGGVRRTEWRPTLADGAYQITARLREGKLLLDQRVTGLRIGPAPRRGGGRGILVVLALVLALFVLGFLLFVLGKRRGEERDEADGRPRAPTRTGAR